MFIDVLYQCCIKNLSLKHTHTHTQVTYADFAVYLTVDMITEKFPDVLEKYPTVAKLKASVAALPNISKWLKERPESQYPPGYSKK